MRTRLALAGVLACLIAGLLPTAAGASGPLCVERTVGQLHFQVGYCP
jgi:hypothetical protein